MAECRVTIVVDRQFGEALLRLPAGEPVWIIDSASNHEAIQKMWWDPVGKEFKTGVTSFKDTEGKSPEDVVLAMLNTIYDHHGPYSQDPPVDAIRIIGAKRTDAICRYYADDGFGTIIGDDNDYEIRK